MGSPFGICVLESPLVAVDDPIRDLNASVRRTLAVLVAVGPNGLSTARFADLIFGDGSSFDRASVVRMAVSRLRRRLPAGSVPPASSTGYRLRLEDDDVDIWYLSKVASSGFDISDVDPDKLRHLLLGTVPDVFYDLPSDLAATGYDVQRRQLSLFFKLSDSDWQRLGIDLPSLGRKLLYDNPFDEGLLEALAMAAIRQGLPKQALDMIVEARERLRFEGLGFSHRISALEAELQRFAGSSAHSTAGADGIMARISRTYGPWLSQVSRRLGEADIAEIDQIISRVGDWLSKQSLSLGDGDFVAAQLETIRSQMRSGEPDDLIVERALGLLVSRLTALGARLSAD